MIDSTSSAEFSGYESLFRLDGQVHVVLGAGQGIGRAAATALHQLGAKVLCVDRSADRARATAEAFGSAFDAGDITVEDEVIRILDRAQTEFGQLDGVVDVVGGARFVPIRELDPQTWDLQFDANLRHAYFVGRHAAMRMADAGGGNIVFVTSIAALFGSAAHPVYSAAKLALVSWVRSLAEEFGPQNVRANSVAPGATLTDRMRQAWTDDAVLEDMAAPTMLQRLGRVEEIAGTIAFLLSAASGNITGQTIVADGGASVRDPVYGGGRNRAVGALQQAQNERLAAGQPWP